MIMRILRRLAKGVLSFLNRMLGNKPSNPYEQIIFGAAYASHEQYKGTR